MKIYNRIIIALTVFGFGALSWFIFAPNAKKDREFYPGSEEPTGERLRGEELDRTEDGKSYSLDWRLRASDLETPVVFEKEISPELGEIILSDLQLIFEYDTDYSVNENVPVREFILNDVLYRSDRYLYMTGPGRRHPEQMRGEFGWLVDIRNEDHIVITETLIDSYRQAVELSTRHPGIFEQLDDLVADLNNMEQWPKDFDEVIEKFYLYQEASQIRENLKNHLDEYVARLSGYVYLEPSLLSVVEASDFFETKQDAFWAKIDRLKDGIVSPGYQAVYIDGEWKLFVADY